MTKGTLKVHLVDPTSLMAALSKCPKFLQVAGGDGMKIESVTTFAGAMKNANQEVADALAKLNPPCDIITTDLKAGECLFTPLGWFVSMASVNGVEVGGLRKSALVKSSPVPLTTIKQCADGDGAAATIACIDILLNVINLVT